MESNLIALTINLYKFHFLGIERPWHIDNIVYEEEN